jgi:hypothetical protein
VDFIFGSTTGFATHQFTTEVGLVNLDLPLQTREGISFRHGLHQLS